MYLNRRNQSLQQCTTEWLILRWIMQKVALIDLTCSKHTYIFVCIDFHSFNLFSTLSLIKGNDVANFLELLNKCLHCKRKFY